MEQDSLAERVAGQAEFAVNSLQETRYQFAEAIDAAAGQYYCDCSGFVGFVLEATAPHHYELIPKEAGQSRPRAFEYYNFFSTLEMDSTQGWSRIDSLSNAQRGDIIAWQIPDFQPGGDTGHVFFVADAPEMLASGVLAVRAYDSSAYLHFDDTRGTGPEQFPNGVGSGFINFQVNEAGVPEAFVFGPSDPAVALPIAVGRFEPLSVNAVSL